MTKTAARRLPTFGTKPMTSAPGNFDDARRPRPRKGIRDIAGSAWQDLGDLIQAELALLRAEISEKLALTAWSASLIGGGAVLLVATLVLLLQATIGALVALGVLPLAAILIVAAVSLVLGGGLVFWGLNNLAYRLAPTKTISQIQKDARTLTGLE
jgi:Putative Actinobacterial Holin-X, holin superfamily III